jgi:hypothetical protein
MYLILFCLSYFSGRPLCFYLGPGLDCDPPTYAFCVAGTTVALGGDNLSFAELQLLVGHEEDCLNLAEHVPTYPKSCSHKTVVLFIQLAFGLM